VNWKGRRLIKNLYTQQTTFVRVRDWKSASCKIGRDVRQGCRPSKLFNLYVEAMMREATSDSDIGVKVGSHVIKPVRFADDRAVVASSEKVLQ